MMRKNKRGVTLVELIICCGIMVMVGGACTAVLMSGHNIFNNSANAANTQLDADVIQMYLTNAVPRATAISQIEMATDDLEVAEARSKITGCCLYFHDDTFYIRSNGKDIAIPSVVDFKYHLENSGKTGSTSARALFTYTVTGTDGSSYSSGFVLGNIPLSKAASGLKTETSANDTPVYLAGPVIADPAT